MIISIISSRKSFNSKTSITSYSSIIFWLIKIKDDKTVVSRTNETIDLYDALKSLNQKEHRVIKQRYFEGLSQSEIAKELFISQAQVSRIERKALDNLHNYLK